MPTWVYSYEADKSLLCVLEHYKHGRSGVCMLQLDTTTLVSTCANSFARSISPKVALREFCIALKGSFGLAVAVCMLPSY